MPRQNRVSPFGEIAAVAARGAAMGNRGRLHHVSGKILRPWQVTRWLLCRLEFNGRKRTVMGPNTYTELFFLDEATGLAAGHRPCFECRRASYHAFASAWARGNPQLIEAVQTPTAGLIDLRLHEERIGADNAQKTHRAKLEDLPDGVFVTLDDDRNQPLLVHRGFLYRWTHAGYSTRVRHDLRRSVTVLTPRSTVNAIASGYAPEVHPSLCSLSD